MEQFTLAELQAMHDAMHSAGRNFTETHDKLRRLLNSRVAEFTVTARQAA